MDYARTKGKVEAYGNYRKIWT